MGKVPTRHGSQVCKFQGGALDGEMKAIPLPLNGRYTIQQFGGIHTPLTQAMVITHVYELKWIKNESGAKGPVYVYKGVE